MSHKLVRTKRTASSHNERTLVEEAATVGVAFDTSVGDTMGRGLSRDGSPPGHRASDLDLAVNSGAVDDSAAKCFETPRSNVADASAALRLETPRSNAEDASAAKRLETPHGTNAVVDASAAVRLETSHVANCVVDDSAANANVISAEGELSPWSLPAVNLDSLCVYPGPYISRTDLEEYMLEFQRQFNEDTDESDTTDLDVILAPVIEWGDKWTLAPNKKGAKNEHESKVDSQRTALTIQPKFFPDWFGLSDDEDTLGPIPEGWAISTVARQAPELPKFQPMDLSIFEGILQEMSDDEDIVQLLSEFHLPEVEPTEEAQIQAAIIESLKDSPTNHLEAEEGGYFET
ncbi:hypothetical protein DFH09DRAFT_1335530 [Mycena vulgaris]|nr:hypothetical protein DFH09DRAFT_1335530 [Mycena vulgaris]